MSFRGRRFRLCADEGSIRLALLESGAIHTRRAAPGYVFGHSAARFAFFVICSRRAQTVIAIFNGESGPVYHVGSGRRLVAVLDAASEWFSGDFNLGDHR